MPTPTYIPLQTITLGSDTASITFASIPSSYTDLRLVIQGSLTNNSYLLGCQINSLTTQSYYYVWMKGNGSSASSGTKNLVFGGLTVEAGNNANNIYLVDFLNANSTVMHKTYLSRHSNPDSKGAIALAGRIATNDAISSITLKEGGDGGSGTFGTGDLKSGMIASLYGIAS